MKKILKKHDSSKFDYSLEYSIYVELSHNEYFNCHDATSIIGYNLAIQLYPTKNISFINNKHIHYKLWGNE